MHLLLFYSIASLLLLPIHIAADFYYTHEPDNQPVLPAPIPWFTGPLLAPSGNVIPKGHVNVQPYVFSFVNNANYNKQWHADAIENFYSTNALNVIQWGFIERCDLQMTPQFIWNSTQGKNYAGIADLPVSFAMQIVTDSVEHWGPALKLSLFANVPLGRYKKLSADKLGTDAVGSGSWQPGVALNFSKLYQFGNGPYFLSTRLSFSYEIGTVAYVKGLNTYGGGIGTRGKVYPGNVFIADGAIEFNLSQNWAFAMDMVYTHANKTRFSGKTSFINTLPSAEQYSLAPAIEYNFNENIGVIGGVWFTIAGRNTSRFASGVLAVNIYI